MSEYDRVMKQLDILTTGGANITWIREAMTLIAAERALTDGLAVALDALVAGEDGQPDGTDLSANLYYDGMIAEAEHLLARWREARER